MRPSEPTPVVEPTLQVEFDGNSLSVRAEEASLEDVLDAIAEKANIRVFLQRGLERTPVNVEIRGAPLGEVLRRVLRRRNYAIHYRATDAGLEIDHVRVLHPPDREEATKSGERWRQGLERARLERQRLERERLERQRR